MGGGGDAGAEPGLHGNRDFGKVRLDGEGVAHDTDVGTQAAQLNRPDCVRAVLLGEPLGKFKRSECGLFKYERALLGSQRLELVYELPAVCALYAVGDG